MGTFGKEEAGCCGGDSLNATTPLRSCESGSYVYRILGEEGACGPVRRVSELGEQKK